MTYTATKRDAHGNRIDTPMAKDSRGNYRPLTPVAVTACRLCGKPNHRIHYSTCSRCGRG